MKGGESVMMTIMLLYFDNINIYGTCWNEDVCCTFRCLGWMKKTSSENEWEWSSFFSLHIHAFYNHVEAIMGEDVYCKMVHA